MDIVVIGNCQAQRLARVLSIMAPGVSIRSVGVGAVKRGEADLGDSLVLLQSWISGGLRTKISDGRSVIDFPSVEFWGFHPDMTAARHQGQPFAGAMGDNHSALTLFAWSQGWSVQKAVSLFTPDIFRTVGFTDRFAVDAAEMVRDWTACGLSLDLAALPRLFMHTTLHPTLPVFGEIARQIADRLGLKVVTRHPERLMTDDLAAHHVWPVYPGVAEALDLTGEYAFKLNDTSKRDGRPAVVLSLEDFVARSFAAYDGLDPRGIECPAFGAFASLLDGDAVPVRASDYIRVLCDEEKYDPA